MTKHEKLMAEYEDLYIEERQMINDGLYADGCIWINENLEGNEKLFVMAHELGHAILHPRENCYFIKHKTLFLNSRKEQEANTFAINLLVPDDLITEYMRYQECTIDQLSRILGYQKELIELRLK